MKLPLHSLLAAALAFGSNLTLAETKPNILVIVADDMGYADVGFQGCKDIPTPHIDSLAANGVRCSSGYVSGPVCSPTRAGLMTGRYQNRFGHELNPPGPPGPANLDFGLPRDEVTVAKRLKDAGYVTGMVGKWHLGHRDDLRPPKRGFDEFFGFLGGQHAYQPPLAPDGINAIRRGDTPVEEKEYLTTAFGREASAFIERHHDKNWFLYLPFNAVHTPMHATPEKIQRFSNIADPQRRIYAAMQSSMDDAIGRVLNKLRERKLEESTLVFFFSDNGGTPPNSSRNTPLSGHKGTTWEGGIRVPFVVQWKGTLPAGKVYDQPVIQLDVLPTALAAAGVSAQPDWRLDGVNLLPFLRGESEEAPHACLFWRFSRQMAVRAGDWKLVKPLGRGMLARAGGGRVNPDGAMLFNLAKDIGEKEDLAAEHPERVAQLAKQWNEWNANLPDPAWTGGRQAEPPKPRRARANQP